MIKFVVRFVFRSSWEGTRWHGSPDHSRPHSTPLRCRQRLVQDGRTPLWRMEHRRSVYEAAAEPMTAPFFAARKVLLLPDRSFTQGTVPAMPRLPRLSASHFSPTLYISSCSPKTPLPFPFRPPIPRTSFASSISPRLSSSEILLTVFQGKLSIYFISNFHTSIRHHGVSPLPSLPRPALQKPSRTSI